jgi:NOL1/NOP2/fmu family ribosome biogenesis protein
MCAERQLYILENLLPALKDGGRLIYSTCTYSLEENEMTLAQLMERHPELTPVKVGDELTSATADGIDFDGHHPEMKLARRFYPHISEGEGQFVAVLKKAENTAKKSTILYKDSSISPSKAEIQIAEKYLKDIFSEVPSGRLIKQGDYIALVPHACPIPKKSVFMPGIMVGEIQKNILKPHHQLFSAYGDKMKNKIHLTKGDARVQKYLRGEEIECETGLSGWCAVIYEGVALGGGKISGGRVKNHYPKGLRNN